MWGAELSTRSPVVDELRVGQVELIDLALLLLGAALEGLDEQQQREQPLFVHGGPEQRDKVRDRRVTAFAADLAQQWHRDADEHVAFRVLAGPGLEEALQPGDARRVRPLPQARGNLSAHRIHVVLKPTP
jgi:GrpB-like predicted nucleotidyltransferase (UPF0157 family)